MSHSANRASRSLPALSDSHYVWNINKCGLQRREHDRLKYAPFPPRPALNALYRSADIFHKEKKTLVYSAWQLCLIQKNNKKKTHSCCVHNGSVNLYFSTYNLVCMLAGVRGGKVEGGHIGGEQVFFDLLELKASWVSSGEGKKRRKERERESCHFKPLSLAIKLLQ